MRRELILCKSRKTAWKRAPWACQIVKVEGGFLAFENYQDFRLWKNQK